MLSYLILANVGSDPIGTAKAAQDMLDKNVYTAVIVGMGAAILGLVGWLMRTLRSLNAVQEKRIEDRDAFQEKLDALSRDTANVVKENTQTMFVLTRAVEELHGTKHPRPKPHPTTPPKEGTG